jgi:hypothetical protein
MFYEEELIEGILHWRGEPNGEWRPVLVTRLSQRVLDAERLLRTVDAAIPDTWYQGAYTNIRVEAMVKQWQKIYPLALSAEGFQVLVADSLRELRAEIEAESNKFDSGLESWPYDDCRLRLEKKMDRLGIKWSENPT